MLSPRVCVVDDDESARRALGRLLRELGFHPVAFASAEEYLEAAAREPCDCLLLDMQLERMSGLELMERLAASGSRVPVIIISAHDEPALRARAFELGCAAYFRKTDPGAKIIEALRRVTAH
ncbi:MAG TPA: response regulator [Steroidobacteraceae bacterium]|nr:response regulator [Steroidobacteraceae bacterium]